MWEIRLKHRFGDFTLDLALEAPKGVTVLFGRSGSGKSTVAKSVAGLMRPDVGFVRVGDHVLGDTEHGLWTPPNARGLGYVFQEPRLFPHMTVRRNLLYGAQDADALGRIADLLDIAPLLERRPAGLSGGEASRVALGRALLSAPRLLILDEPLAALDAARKADIIPYLERLRDEAQMPMLYITHALDEVARLGTTMVVLDAGRVVQSGAVSDVLSDPEAAPMLGPRAAGAVLEGRVAGFDDGLSKVDVASGVLWVPGRIAQVGARVRLRVMAQDVIIGTQAPEGLSALNVLPTTVVSIHKGAGPGAMVLLDGQGDRILARITQRSLARMGLVPGQRVYAILKSVSVGPEVVFGG